MTICAYIRVSTDKQTNENQRFEITNWCGKRGWDIGKWVAEDGVSGAKDYKKRKLGQLMAELNDGDTLVACEISRFGRDLMMVMEILRHLMDKHIKVFTVKDNFTLSDEIQSKVIAFAFGLAAEIERNLIRQRTKAALDRLKAEGKRLGRPVGVGEPYRAVKGRENEVLAMLATGKQKKEVCATFGIDRATLRRFLIVSGHTELIGKPAKKADIGRDDLQRLADKGYTFARAARTLGVCVTTIRGYAKRYGIDFHAGMEGQLTHESIFDYLNEKKSEVLERRARGETYSAIRKSFDVSPTMWSVWLQRVGLQEIQTLEKAKTKRVEILMLATQGLSPRQIAIALNIRQKLVRVVLNQPKDDRMSLTQLTVAECAIAKQNGIHRYMIGDRLRRGWTVADAINTPPMRRGRRK